MMAILLVLLAIILALTAIGILNSSDELGVVLLSMLVGFSAIPLLIIAVKLL